MKHIASYARNILRRILGAKSAHRMGARQKPVIYTTDPVEEVEQIMSNHGFRSVDPATMTSTSGRAEARGQGGHEKKVGWTSRYENDPEAAIKAWKEENGYE